MTWSALHHHSVRQEIATEENTREADSGQVVFEDYSAFDWANFTLDEMESLNKAACARLNEIGYNGDELLAK